MSYSDEFVRLNLVSSSVPHNETRQAVVNETREGLILKQSENYLTAVEEMDLNKFMLPVYKPEYQDDSGKTYLKFTLENRTSGARTGDYIVLGKKSKFYYSYQDIVNDFNEELDRICDLVSLPGVDKPVLKFENNKWSLSTTEDFRDNYYLFVNFEAFALFDKFEYEGITMTPSDLFARLSYNNVSSGDYVFMARQTNLNSWCPVKAIIVESDIPVNKELVTTKSSTGGSVAVNKSPILTSYPYNPNDSSPIENILYVSNPYRWYSMMKDRSFKSVSMAFYWVDKQNEKYPIMNFNGGEAHIKQVFKKQTDNLSLDF